MWDECDRVRHLLQNFNDCNIVDSSVLDRVRRSRVYVDEIQDYTQIECLVFFYLGGPSGLFLAGDSAQSVVEGTEFRFEEIRSIGYFVAGSDRHDLVPQKPKKEKSRDLKRVEEELADLLTAQVEIRIKKTVKRHGRIEDMCEVAISFGSLDALNGIIDKLRVA